ncbi:CheY-like protein [Venustampulla echinocandica]|uniref:CheY-like protein n=1 Tax=Venustampulla echinocandica TaxID=2656787 RepID=A0A370TR44_9HELO|nr:CheY-like protein [Venustampulla echinocandica]RDL38000.1 CheY-like protein [Venustampulla echinocandica]
MPDREALESPPKPMAAHTPEPTDAQAGVNKEEWVTTNVDVKGDVVADGAAAHPLDRPLDRPGADIVVDSSMRIVQISASYLALNSLLPIDGCHYHYQFAGLDVFDAIKMHGLVPEPDSWRHAIHNALTKQDAYATADIDSTGQKYWCLRVVPVFQDSKLAYIALYAQVNVARHQTEPSGGELDVNDTYRILVETVKDYAIFMLDTRGNVKTWNATATLMKGYKPEEIIGHHFSTFYGDEDIKAQKPKKELEICLREGKVEDESWRYRKNGSRFWANVVITSVYRKGMHIGFSKVTRDLTERKAAESRLISAYEESEKLKSAFLANMSHEIRTPMHGMLTALTLLMDSPLTQEQRELGGIINESGSVLLQVINDILDYSRLASGVFSISLDVISIPDIITSVVRSIRPTLKPGITLESSLSPNTPGSAKGDPLRYRQIIENLVANSAKFTDAGSIQIDVSVACDDEASYTILTEVTDTGIGIPDHGVKSLFTPFNQFDNSATKRYKGTGLGLTICKSLVELMGGEIGFRPNSDTHGCIFWFTTKIQKINKPKQVDELEKQMEGVNISPPDDPGSLLKQIAPGKRLLLAEDNYVNRRIMLKVLKKFGFEQVDTALEGASAAKLVIENPQMFDLILMDISMPVLDGIGATREIRNAGLTIPIIAMTANALKGDAEVYLAKGMDGYIQKPVRLPLLRETLLTWLKP